MNKPRYRVWGGDEILGRPDDAVVDQSDQLTAAIRPILFGKHPGAQMLTLAELAGIWICGHDEEIRNQAMETFVGAVHDFVKTQKGKIDGQTTEGSN